MHSTDHQPPPHAEFISIDAEVTEALTSGLPVVALETTVVAHALPPDEGLAMATESERRVRAAGAVPATIGVFDGKIRIGMDEAALTRFAHSGAQVQKVTARDLAACLVKGRLGALTIGATLAVCDLVGIRVTSTGGLGGVHRGFAEILDISADMTELSRSRTLVISSGLKSILDVPASLELLETLGVPVVGWRTDSLPLYYKADGGPRLDMRADDADEVAALARTHWALGRSSSVLIARPPTVEIDIEPLTEAGLAAAREQNVTGKDVTPFLLAYLSKHSSGGTTEPHKHLLMDNAALAAELAVALEKHSA